jgi:hypothetical protein
VVIMIVLVERSMDDVFGSRSLFFPGYKQHHKTQASSWLNMVHSMLMIFRLRLVNGEKGIAERVVADT